MRFQVSALPSTGKDGPQGHQFAGARSGGPGGKNGRAWMRWISAHPFSGETVGGG